MSEDARDHTPKVPGSPPDSLRKRSLRHPTRRAILDFLEQKPGSNKHQIGRELGLSAGNLYHHLDKLERHGCIVILNNPGEQEQHCFRMQDADLWLNERTRILFGRKPKRDVAIYVAEHPGQTCREIAPELGSAVSTIRHHLKALRKHDLAHRHRAGRTYVYEPSWGLERWVEKVADGFDRPWRD